MSETTNECRCGRPTRDAAYVCDDCSQRVAVALGEVTWLDEQLEISVSRQKGLDYRRVGGGKGGKKPAERPLPADMGVSEARTHLRALLVSWTLYAAQEGVRNQSPSQELPADNLTALSRYLLWRVDGFTLDDIGADFVDEIVSAVAHCHRVVDRPADRQFLGRCQECNEDGGLYARPGAAMARCDVCHSTVDAQKLRDKLLSDLDDRLCTAAEIARLSTYLGLRKDREQVRNLINQWHKRKRITREAAFADEPVFRFGEVYAMLAKDDYGEKAG